jgi:hypothetical protein
MATTDTITKTTQKQLLAQLRSGKVCNFVAGEAKSVVYALKKKGLVDYSAFADVNNNTNRSYECLQVWLVRE